MCIWCCCFFVFLGVIFSCLRSIYAFLCAFVFFWYYCSCFICAFFGVLSILPFRVFCVLFVVIVRAEGRKHALRPGWRVLH